MRPACCHSRRLSESRMRENLTYGLMRGRRKRAVRLLDRDTHPKGEKRPGVAGPGDGTAPLPHSTPAERARQAAAQTAGGSAEFAHEDPVRRDAGGGRAAEARVSGVVHEARSC